MNKKSQPITYLLSDEMVYLHDQIVNLQLPYLVDIKWSFSTYHPRVIISNSSDYYQSIAFKFIIKDKICY